MNLDAAQWRRLLTEAVTKPVTHVPPTYIKMCDPTKPHVWDEWATDEWSAEQAFHRLDLKLVPFPSDLLMFAEGVALPDGIGLSPWSSNKVRCAVHEIAHMLFGHPMVRVQTKEQAHGLAPVHELEAEGVALCVAFALGESEDALIVSRAYIQEFIHRPTFGHLPTSWDHIIKCAQRILSAGACQRVRYAPAREKQERDIRQFAARVRWDK